ncbi:MAG: hypothetical protein J2P16_00170 [Mycobacterium sp.]|nr:hypothetical protein [Mycobacterium sp.]
MTDHARDVANAVREVVDAARTWARCNSKTPLVDTAAATRRLRNAVSDLDLLTGDGEPV